MRKLLGSITFLFLFASVAAKANLIQNGKFNGTPNTTGAYAGYSDPAYMGDYYDPTTIPGWTFSDTSGILKNNSFGAQFFPANPSGTSQFAFIQDVGSPNAISQTVGDKAGSLYTLSFLLTGSTLTSPIPVFVTINGVPVSTIQAFYGYQGYSINFLGSGSDTISFSSAASGNRLAGLTDVSVGTTPEPSSMMLLGTGLLGVAAAGRRKFLKA